jgi:hypothetical protein
MNGSEMDNVFLSLIQDFGKKLRREPWVAVGALLKSYTRPRRAQIPLKQPTTRDTQFIVVLKGIGVDTYECLKNDPDNADDSEIHHLWNRTRRYLRELTSPRIDYVDKNVKRKLEAGMQNIPLVCGDSMLWSEQWVNRGPALRERWRAEQEARGWSFESGMDELEVS